MSYTYVMCNVPELGETLAEINDSGDTIVSTFFTADTGQVVFILQVAEEEPEPEKGLFDALRERFRPA